MSPRKRERSELGRLSEPHLSQNQEVEFARGVALFNKQQYYEAHEAWENVWREMTDSPRDDAEIIIRGLIQFAAGLYSLNSTRKCNSTACKEGQAVVASLLLKSSEKEEHLWDTTDSSPKSKGTELICC